MAREYEYLLHLMGAHLRKAEPQVWEGIDWAKLARLAHIHSVVGILGAMAGKYPICPDESHRSELRALSRRTIAAYAQRGAKADAVARALDQADVEHILMKGYVLRDYYPVPELRTFGDIDIVIHPQDRERVHQLMLSMGYGVKIDWEPVFTYERGAELYEIHTDIMEVDVSDRVDCRDYFQQMWQFVCREQGNSFHFTPEFHFLYILTHIAKHITSSGAGARMYMDVAAFVCRFSEELDWLWVREELKKLELWEFACVVFTAVERWFGVAVPVAYQPASDAVMAEFLTYTMEAGVFGHHKREGAMAELKQRDSEGIVARGKLLLTRTFPAAHTIQTRYTYLQTQPWLLPVAWVHRLVKTRAGFGKHAHEAQVILSADSAEISRLHNLMRNIGL